MCENAPPELVGARDAPPRRLGNRMVCQETGCISFMLKYGRATTFERYPIFINNAQPYPGTRLTKRCFSEGIIKDQDFGSFLVRKNLMSTGHFISITTPDFDTKEVIRRRDQVIDVFSPTLKVLVKKVVPLYFMEKLKNLRRSF